MRRAIEDLLQKTYQKHIKLLIICRDYYWGLFKGSFWTGVTVNPLPEDVDATNDIIENDNFTYFSINEYECALNLYLTRYQIHGRLIGNAAERCRHPLLMRFFCEAYRGKEIGEVKDIRLKELFDYYWDQKLGSIAEHMIQHGKELLQEGLIREVGDYLLNIASYMLHNKVRVVPQNEVIRATHCFETFSDPHSIFGHVRDEFIIIEEKELEKNHQKTPHLTFVYEEFMEYVMARSLLRDWDEANLTQTGILKAILRLLNEYESFVQIIGVMVYLALMLKERHNIVLWSSLLKQGERWQNVILETIRKLPTDQLDSGVFAALEDMLASNDSTVQEQVLDTLKIKRIGQLAPSHFLGLRPENEVPTGQLTQR